MNALVLYVYRLPKTSATAFEGRMSTVEGEEPARRRFSDRTELLAFLLVHEADGIVEGGRFVACSAPEIVDRCCVSQSVASGPVTVSIRQA